MVLRPDSDRGHTGISGNRYSGKGNVCASSRLEGLNKYYGTNILISDTTAQAVENGFILRDVDLVRVKGKAQGVRIHELIGEGQPDPELARFLANQFRLLLHTASYCLFWLLRGRARQSRHRPGKGSEPGSQIGTASDGRPGPRTLRGLAGHDLEGRVLGQGGGIVVVFVALGHGEQALPHQGQEVMFNLMGITGIMEAAGGMFSDPVAPVQFPEQQAVGIRADPPTGKIGSDFLGEKTLKSELFMADCFHRISLLRSYLFSDYSILPDTLSFFNTFRE